MDAQKRHITKTQAIIEAAAMRFGAQGSDNVEFHKAIARIRLTQSPQRANATIRKWLSEAGR